MPATMKNTLYFLLAPHQLGLGSFGPDVTLLQDEAQPVCCDHGGRFCGVCFVS